MFSENVFKDSGALRSGIGGNHSGAFSFNLAFPRKLIIGTILLVALVAFEMFNFDTTRYALHSLLGEANFMGLTWALVLAIAFCAIDFAGLARLFTPEQGHNEPRAVWFLMGAWLLGATMNAIMTWWAVNLTLLNHELGNEILSRGDLLHYVPLFVAVLVWLTRVLFIGAFAVAGDHLFDLAGHSSSRSLRRGRRVGSTTQLPASDDLNEQPAARPFNPQPKSRIRHQPQMASSGQPVAAGMQAQGRSHR
jgi:hypothetical protein